MGSVVGKALELYNYYNLPITKGSITIPKGKTSLNSDVKVIRDKNGIPHIYGETNKDVLFAQGFVVAQERLVALDIRRRLARGTISEIKPEALLVDRLMRTFGFLRMAKIDLDKYVSEESKKSIQAFCDGINFFLTSKYYQKPLEVTLGLEKPAEFCVLDIIAITRMICWQMNRGYLGKIASLGIKQTLGLDDENPIITNSKNGRINLETLQEVLNVMPPQNQGSNSFVISGEISETGSPIFECDAHLKVMSPSTWMQFHLVAKNYCEETKTHPYDSIGFTMVGFPGVTSGCNKNVAWGTTLSYVSSYDVYVQKINPENDLQYEFDGKWEDFKVVKEEIKIKGKEQPHIETIYYTKQNGVMISTVLNLQDDSKEKLHYSIRSTATEEFENMDIFKLVTVYDSQNIEELKEKLRSCKCVSITAPYCDSKNIGILSTGAIPKRSKIAIEKSGDPYPGNDPRFVWEGFHDKLPFLENPKCGFLIACNHDWFTHFDYDPGFHLGTIFGSVSRPMRCQQLIQEKIKQKGKLSGKDIQEISNDITEYDVSSHIEKAKLIEKDELKDDNHKKVYEYLVNFNGEFSVNSIGAGVYMVYKDQLLFTLLEKNEIKSKILKKLINGGGISKQFQEKTEYLLYRDGIVNVLFKKLSEDEKKEVIKKTIESTYAFLKEKSPPSNANQDDFKSYQYGKLHTITWTCAIGEKLKNFNRGPYPFSGSWGTLKMGGYFADGESYETMMYPSMKHIISMDDFKKYRGAFWPGNSSHIGSKFYDNGIECILKDTLFEDILDEKKIKEGEELWFKLS